MLRGTDTDWLRPASDDFDDFVAKRCDVSIRWDVPSTVLWYVSGEHYLGTLVIRHELTPQLADVGGNVGYHVVAPWRRQGHATRMLAAGLIECRRLGLDRVLLTCDPENVASRRVIAANGGQPDGKRRTTRWKQCWGRSLLDHPHRGSTPRRPRESASQLRNPRRSATGGTDRCSRVIKVVWYDAPSSDGAAQDPLAGIVSSVQPTGLPKRRSRLR